MDEFRFRFRRAAEADIGPACLEIFRIGARRDFTVFSLCREPDFDVEGLGSGEADIARAEADDVVRQAQGLEDIFGVVGQFIEFIIARFRRDVFDHFDFVELVLADEAPRIAASRTGFGTEARRHGREVDRQLGAVDDFTAVVVGQRYFCRRDHVHFFAFDVELVHIFVELRQLACTGHGIAVDDVRRDDFGVAVLFCMLVEHEVVDSAFQAGAGADIIIEAGTRDFSSPFGIEDAQFFTDVPMIEGLEIEFRRFAPFADFRVVAVVVANGDRGVAHIGDHELDSAHVSFNFLDFFIEDVDVVAELLHGCDLGVRIFFVAFELADFLGDRIAFVLHGFDFLKNVAALVVQGDESVDIGFGMAVLNIFFDFFHVFADEFRI